MFCDVNHNILDIHIGQSKVNVQKQLKLVVVILFLFKIMLQVTFFCAFPFSLIIQYIKRCTLDIYKQIIRSLISDAVCIKFSNNGWLYVQSGHVTSDCPVISLL